MDTSDPQITFDEKGTCVHCLRAENEWQAFRQPPEVLARRVSARIDQIRERNHAAAYDCVMGISGGVDSSFALIKAKELGLRILAVHCDTGWNSEIAVSNIYNLVSRLNLDLETYVVDWPTMRRLQVAFFKASVPNCDIPQDHAIVAVNNLFAMRHGVKDFISGGNLCSEAILPGSWGHDARDLVHLKAIAHRYDCGPLKNYPIMSGFDSYVKYPYWVGVRNYRLLNDIGYKREVAKRILIEHYGWRDYGGKHHESVFTKFFQAYYLPTKFGFDKRRAHLASMIVAGEISREQALEELRLPLYQERDRRRDQNFFLDKLEVEEEEWQAIMQSLPLRHEDFPTNTWWRSKLSRVKQAIEGRGYELRKSW